ncbi:MAG: ABC transporter permease [Gammaproteobacteria bacterium]|nr:ABC transporter permease [Gammaproteobacteria bacterium]MDE2345546.1 ABC transporter permease [Gammaproteobacteria bacterium]
MRLRGLLRKEFLQIIRDPSSIAIALAMPVILLLLFGYGVSLDAKHVPLALVVEQPSAEAASFTAAFNASEYFNPQAYQDMRSAELALMAGRVDGIVRLRGNFVSRLVRGPDAPIQVVVSGMNANNARLIEGYVSGVWRSWLTQQAGLAGRPLAVPVSVEQRVWFNSAVRSKDFLVPGLIAVIMTLIGAMLTALVMAREWERGTMEALMVTPVSMREILIGKLVPYFALGMGGMALSVIMALWLFGVPLHGSLLLLFLCAALFMLAALGMGLLVSVVARSQFVASLVALVTTFLPAFLLSGFIFDVGSMPHVVQAITYLIAARYFVSILQTLFLAGNVWVIIIPNALALCAMAAVFLLVARRRSHKRLQ